MKKSKTGPPRKEELNQELAKALKGRGVSTGWSDCPNKVALIYVDNKCFVVNVISVCKKIKGGSK